MVVRIGGEELVAWTAECGLRGASFIDARGTSMNTV
jgi:hypothetical protein